MSGKPLNLPTAIRKFFGEYLPLQRGCSPHTIAAYRDTFSLFLKYLQKKKKIRPERVSFDDLTASSVMNFLNDIQKTRGNKDSTRNARLAVFHSFIKYLLIENPVLAGNLGGILSIPTKKTTKPVLDFLTQKEMEAIINTQSDNTWCGRRNRTLLSMMYNTGARVSEIITLRVSDLRIDAGGTIHLFGKGRKNRVLPFWNETFTAIRKWIESNGYSHDSLLFPSNRGTMITRSAVAKLLTSAVDQATKTCPSLKRKKVSPHTIRHSTAVKLLQSGVDLTMIALWLGHESIETTHIYMSADVEMKTKALQSVQSPEIDEFRYVADDSVLAYLDSI